MKKPTTTPPEGARTVRARVEYQRGSCLFWLRRADLRGLDDPLMAEGSRWAFACEGKRWAVQEVERDDPDDAERVIVTREFVKDEAGEFVAEPCQATGWGRVKNWQALGGIALIVGDLWEVSAMNGAEVDLTLWPHVEPQKPPIQPPQQREFTRKRVLRRVP